MTAEVNNDIKKFNNTEAINTSTSIGIKKGPPSNDIGMGDKKSIITENSSSVISIIASETDNSQETNKNSSKTGSKEGDGKVLRFLYNNPLRGLFNFSNSISRTVEADSEYIINTVKLDAYTLQARLPADLEVNINPLHFILFQSLEYNFRKGNKEISHKMIYELMPHKEVRQLNNQHEIIEESMEVLKNLEFRLFPKYEMNLPESLGKEYRLDGWYSLNIEDTMITSKCGRSQKGYLIDNLDVISRILEKIPGKYDYIYIDSELLKMSFYSRSRESYITKSWIPINICLYDILMIRIALAFKDKDSTMNKISLQKLYQLLEPVNQKNIAQDRLWRSTIKELIIGFLEAFKRQGVIRDYTFWKNGVNLPYGPDDPSKNLDTIEILF